MNLQSQRLTSEIKKAEKERSSNFYIFPDGENLKNWKGYIRGPHESPYEGGAFEIRITLDDNHPFNPPKVHFITKIFHPNIQWKSGEVCIDILKNQWSPMWSLITLEKAIVSILMDPNADSPLNCDAGNMIRAGDLSAFQSTAAMCTNLYAIKDDEYLALFQ